MNSNFETTPNAIFDWIEKFDFSQLSEAQQKDVISHFSKEEYEAMHHAAMNLKFAAAFKTEQPNETRKNQLLEKFDAQHADKNVIPLFSKPVIWQAASVLLFLLAGWLFFKVADLKKETGIKQMAGIDTVFVDRIVDSTPGIIHDTVYLYKKQANTQETEQAHEAEAMVNSFDSENTGIQEDDIYIVPVNDSSSNERRGKSMRDDSLLKKYGFISL